MSDYIECWVPVVASVKYKVKKPTDWNRLTPELRAEYALEHGKRLGHLCHHCSDAMECDYEPSEHVLKCLTEEFKDE